MDENALKQYENEIDESSPTDDWWMLYAFGTLAPRIADLPHLIFEADRNVYHLLSELAGSVWANLWDPPVFDTNGNVYDDNNVKDFILWRSDDNQEWFLERLHPLDKFVVRIPVDTPPEIIESVRMKFDFDKLEAFCAIFDYVPDCIDEIKIIWCQFQDDVGPNDILIASPEHKDFIEEFGKRMALIGQDARQLKKKDGYYSWPFL